MSNTNKKENFAKLNALVLEQTMAPIEYDVDGQKVKLSPSIVKEFIANNQDITNAEYKMFIDLCVARKLNPFLKEVHLIKYGNAPAQIVVGKDAIIKRAVKHPDFKGREQGVVVVTKDDEVVYRKGALVIDGETLVGGWAKVYRNGWNYPVETAVSLKEAIQTTKEGKPNVNWATRPATMVEKVALTRALREAFVEDFGGMYDEDEVWSNHKEEIIVVKEQPDPFDVKTGELIHQEEIGETETKEMSLNDL